MIEEKDQYRDNIATVDKAGKRVWVFPKMPKGNFYEYRKWISYLLLIVLFGLPFIHYNGDPFVMFNFPEGKIFILGMFFGPQDFHLLVIGMLAAIVFIALFTAIFGRLFCGWVCPQTIFMEMVYRRIEYWIEGDASAQKRLVKSDWNYDKIKKKTIKHFIFLLISIAIAHTFLSYIIGIDAVWQILTEPISQHVSGFIAMVIFTAVFHAVFTILREQVCTTICPYGRLQGVLLDENSLAVAYDFVRGEPRGKLSKARKGKKSNCQDGCSTCRDSGSSCPSDLIVANMEAAMAPPQGDCIECTLCVQVCPTGIDIRNGTQLECINCTACMDACDEVMIKIGKPQKLIRIDSYNGITKGTAGIWTKRVLAYTGVLLSLIVLESFLLVSRTDVETLFLRTPGMMFQETDDGYISNLYNYQLINKTRTITDVEFSTDDYEGVIFEVIGMKNPSTSSNGSTEGAVFVKIPKATILKRKTNLNIEVKNEDGKVISIAKTTFFSPGN